MTRAINASGCAPWLLFVARASDGSWTVLFRRSSPVREHPAELVFIAGLVLFLVFGF
jgi:hypothetical protein